MGEILGLGATHYPSLCAPPERMLGFFHHILSAPNIDPKYKDRANWPSEMLAEMGNDEGRGSIERYRERMWANFRKQRKMIDDFAPAKHLSDWKMGAIQGLERVAFGVRSAPRCARVAHASRPTLRRRSARAARSWRSVASRRARQQCAPPGRRRRARTSRARFAPSASAGGGRPGRCRHGAGRRLRH